MSGKYLVVTGDMNDGDDRITINKVSDKQLTALEPIIKALKEHKATKRYECNWPSGNFGRDESPEKVFDGILSEDQIGLMDGFVAHGDYGIHSITDIEVWEVVSKERLF